MSFDELNRAKKRAEHTRAVADLLAVLDRHHGAPLRDGLPPFVESRRWVAIGRQLFTDQPAREFCGPTAESARALAAEEGCASPTLHIVCELCGARLKVVDQRNAASLHSYHQATERCFYRSIVLALVWRGFAPLEGRVSRKDREPAPHASRSRIVREVLQAIEGPGAARDSLRVWAPMPGALAYFALKQRALLTAEPITEEQLERLQDTETLAKWTPAALALSSEIIERAWWFDRAEDVFAVVHTRAVALLDVANDKGSP